MKVVKCLKGKIFPFQNKHCHIPSYEYKVSLYLWHSFVCSQLNGSKIKCSKRRHCLNIFLNLINFKVRAVFASVHYICMSDLVYNSLTLHFRVEINWKRVICSASKFQSLQIAKKDQVFYVPTVRRSKLREFKDLRQT